MPNSRRSTGEIMEDVFCCECGKVIGKMENYEEDLPRIYCETCAYKLR